MSADIYSEIRRSEDRKHPPPAYDEWAQDGDVVTHLPTGLRFEVYHFDVTHTPEMACRLLPSGFGVEVPPPEEVRELGCTGIAWYLVFRSRH